MMDDATAGSIPTLFKINGMPAPDKPATIKFAVIAKNITKPNNGVKPKKDATIPTIKPLMAPFIMPTENSFNTVR